MAALQEVSQGFYRPFIQKIETMTGKEIIYLAKIISEHVLTLFSI